MQAVASKIEYADNVLVQQLQAGDKAAFEELFFRYHAQLCSVAAQITASNDRARDVVQDVFLRIWTSRSSLEINASVQAYLYRAVWNEALNAKKRKESRRNLSQNFSQYLELANSSSNTIQSEDQLVHKIWKIVDEMPERRRFVFTLHRKHGLTYKEISKVMDITRKTVENHMGLALKEIRSVLR